MNRLTEVMSKLSLKGEKAFVPYIMAGDGGLDQLGNRIRLLEKFGATAIEVGIPFSDPVADGPTIQKAGLRALENGTTLRKVLEELRVHKDSLTVPIIIMTYLNPILAYGIANFLRVSKEANVAAVIIPDLPYEEEGIILGPLQDVNIELIRLVTLTTPMERVAMLSAKGNSFLYCVTVKGITGTRQNFDEELLGFLKRVKEQSGIPVLAGFGISDLEQAKNLADSCDGVVVGSKIVELFQENRLQDIEHLISNFKNNNIEV